MTVFGGGDLGQRARSCWGWRHAAPAGVISPRDGSSAQSRHPASPVRVASQARQMPDPGPSLTYPTKEAEWLSRY
jgi:hypothetical protein